MKHQTARKVATRPTCLVSNGNAVVLVVVCLMFPWLFFRRPKSIHQYSAERFPTNTCEALWCVCCFFRFPWKEAFWYTPTSFLCVLRHLSFQSWQQLWCILFPLQILRSFLGDLHVPPVGISLAVYLLGAIPDLLAFSCLVVWSVSCKAPPHPNPTQRQRTWSQGIHKHVVITAIGSTEMERQWSLHIGDMSSHKKTIEWLVSAMASLKAQWEEHWLGLSVWALSSLPQVAGMTIWMASSKQAWAFLALETLLGQRDDVACSLLSLGGILCIWGALQLGNCYPRIDGTRLPSFDNASTSHRMAKPRSPENWRKKRIPIF